MPLKLKEIVAGCVQILPTILRHTYFAILEKDKDAFGDDQAKGILFNGGFEHPL